MPEAAEVAEVLGPAFFKGCPALILRLVGTEISSARKGRLHVNLRREGTALPSGWGKRRGELLSSIPAPLWLHWALSALTHLLVCSVTGFTA